MPLQAITDAAPQSASPFDAADLEAEERRRIIRYGIGFDGRCYRYREYRYDRLADALRYAELDSARSGRPPLQAPGEWLAPHRPTAEDREVMASLGIAFDGKHYLYDGYRYDRCGDAVAYARLKSARR
ncbi:MAG TPA: hypothetical protein VFF03_13230 [Rhodocyclaceae bacterium]|nr:hypothetical protein [Rhodocyclaceae bacterium]